MVTLRTFDDRRLLARPGAAALFCSILGRLRRRLGFRLHAYVILPDRVGLIVGTDDGDPHTVRWIVQQLKSRFAREENARRGRSGLIWKDAGQWFALARGGEIDRRSRFLHRAPLLARLARHPRDWRWSSYRSWAGEGRSPLPIDPAQAKAGRVT